STTPTRFPYTTLFRSSVRRASCKLALHLDLDAVQDRLRQLNHRGPPVHSAALQTAEGLGFRPAVAFHEHTLGPFDSLAILQVLRSEEHTSELQSPDHL